MTPPRDPEATRQHILQTTAGVMIANGFKAASLSDILEKAGVSKGALYHHFANKQELGYAVFDEVFVTAFLEDWEEPLSQENPLEAMCEWLSACSGTISQEELDQGCAMGKIAMEMSSVDEGFKIKAVEAFLSLSNRIEAAFSEAHKKGYIRKNVVPRSVAMFIVAAMQGMIMQGRTIGDPQLFAETVSCLTDYLITLKP